MNLEQRISLAKAATPGPNTTMSRNKWVWMFTPEEDGACLVAEHITDYGWERDSATPTEEQIMHVAACSPDWITELLGAVKDVCDCRDAVPGGWNEELDENGLFAETEETLARLMATCFVLQKAANQ